MANVIMQLLLDARQMVAGLNQATAQMQSATSRMSQQVNRTGTAMTKTAKKTTGFAGAIDFLKKRVIGAGLFFAAFYQMLILLRQTVGEVISEFFDLDDSLRRVQSITKESDASIARLRAELLDLAKSGDLFDQSAADVAESMFTIAQAGFDTGESLELAKLAAEGAAVGFTTAEVAAKVLVNVLKAYDMPVSKAREVMDILFQTVDTGIVTFEDLSNNLGRVLASASALEVPLTDITGTVATLTLRGFTAAQAMTSVNRILQTFIRPSNRAKEAAEALGIELNRDTIAAEGLVPMLNQMWVAADGDANAFANMFDRIQSTRGALSLMSDDGILMTRVMEDMGGATEGAGAMAEAMEHRSKSLKFQMAQLRVQILAVATEALTPLAAGIATFLQHTTSILKGENALLNYFGDFKALVAGLVAAFVVMKRVAITSMFTSIGAAALGLVDTLRLVAMGAWSTATAVGALGAAFMALAPLIAFIIFFSLAKLMGQMDNTDAAMDKMGEATERFAKKLETLQSMDMPDDLLQVRKFELSQNEMTRLVAEMVGDFQKAADEVDDLFGISIGAGVGEALDQVARSIFSLGTTTESELDKIRRNFKMTIDEMIEGAELSAEELKVLALTFSNLEKTAETGKQAEMYRMAAERLGIAADEAMELEGFIREAEKAAIDFNTEAGNAVISADSVNDAIEAWLEPIEAAKKLMEEILGLTSRQEFKLRAEIAPLETRIAERNRDIAIWKGAALDREGELIDAGVDLEEVEDDILIAIQDQIDGLERQNEVDDNLIAQKEALLEIEDKIDAELQAQLDLLNLTIGRMPALLSLTDEQQRLLAVAVGIMVDEGAPALEDWIRKEEEAGRVMDEDVLAALQEVVDKMKDENNELSLDVTQALINLGLVNDELDEAEQAWGALGSGFGEGAGTAPGMGRQHGVRSFIGGMALVGEEGPELIRLPRGVDVVPNGMIAPAIRETLPKPQAQRAEDVGAKRQTVIYIDHLTVEGNPREALEALGLQAAAAGVVVGA